MQFSSVPGTGTTGAIFTVIQLQEQYLGRKRKLHFVLVDLEKDFKDRVPREVALLAMRKLDAGVQRDSRTSAKVNEVLHEEFEVKVGSTRSRL